MRPSTLLELQSDIAEIIATRNYCWAQFVLNTEQGLCDEERSALVDVIIASGDEVRAIATLGTVPNISEGQMKALRRIAA